MEQNNNKSISVESLERFNTDIQALQNINPNEAIAEAHKYLDLAIELYDKEHQVYANYLLAYNYTNIGKYHEAISYYLNCIQSIDNPNSNMFFKAHNGLGLAYKQLGEYQKALSYYYIALRGNITDQLGSIFNNISIVYRNLNNLDKAIEYSEKAYEFNLQKNHISTSLDILANIGNYKILQKKYDEAKTILLKTREDASKHQLLNQVINCDIKLATLYFEQEEYAEALILLEKLTEHKQEQNYKLQNEPIKFLLAQVYAKLKMNTQASVLYEELINAEHYDLYQYKSELESYLQLTKANKQIEKSLELQEKYSSLLIIINNKEKNEDLENAKLLLENKEQELELKRLREVKELNNILEKKSILLEEKQKKLESVNNDLMHFSYALSHDLKEPIRLISNYTDLLNLKLKDRLIDNEKEMFNYIKMGTQKMATLIVELQKFALIDSNDENKESVNINSVLDELLLMMKGTYSNSDISINIEEMPTVFSHEILIKQLFQNLISNAIKYRQQNIPLQIDITSHEYDTYYEIKLSDNGIGIPLKEQTNIFMLFKRASNHKIIDGTGVGLAFCAKIMSKINGSIQVYSQGDNLGTLFTLKFPK